jgi:late competence protein required for DNA uptake (superfamily II DNA/RNA helicase)
VGKTRRDRIWNMYIWKELNQTERSRLKWFGHVKKKEHRVSKRLLEIKKKGSRSMGRPCT